MKKLGILILSVVALYSCQPEHPESYLSVAGKLENAKDSILYITGFGTRKKIKINSDGTFNDSLKVVKPDLYSISAPKSGRAVIYLKNGYNLNITGDANKFFTSFKFEGDDEGADSNNFIVSRSVFGQTVGSAQGFVRLEKEAFLKKVGKFRNSMDSISNLFKNTDAELMKRSDDKNEAFFGNMEKNYDRMHQSVLMQEKIEAKLAKGKPAPEFNDYEDFKGGTKSLKDFKGNFVYIDVWATWCRPCLAQIPFLKKLEKEFEGKNISFVSISTDSDRRSGGDWNKAHQKWKKMVKDKDLSGVQLWAGKDEMRLSQQYYIQGIPRFILIDPDGNIVNKNEQRPSSPGISDYLTSLGVK